MNQDNLLSAHIADRIKQCAERSLLTRTNFLDPYQRLLTENYCRSQHFNRVCFWGGYPEAERVCAVFWPAYYDADFFDSAFSQSSPDAWPAAIADEPALDFLTVLAVRYKSPKELCHRDFLGSLLSLGIKREMTGDILVQPQGCQIIIDRKISAFLLREYAQAGHINLQTELLSPAQLQLQQQQRTTRQLTVSSLRLDVLVAAGFALSRQAAAEAITASLVAVNNRPIQKPDLNVRPGDKISLRGKGKIKLSSLGQITRKGKQAIVIEQYI